MRWWVTCPFFACYLLCGPDRAQAQNITVQQPVFRNFSVGTTVSVPDSGGAFIGGVKRAGESRKHFGPFRSGSSVGLFRDYSGVSTHVTIHDLREMDRRVLEGSARSASPRPRILRGYAAHAYESLFDRDGRGSVGSAGHTSRRGRRTGREYPEAYASGSPREAYASGSPGEAHASGSPGEASRERAEDDVSSRFDPHRYYRLGRKAEQEGRHSVARLHYRMAVRHGSTLAEARLGEMQTRPK